VCDVYDADALARVVAAFRPDLVISRLTDLPDEAARIRDLGAANDRMRMEGTRVLLDAARGAGSPPLFAQGIAWSLERFAPFERMVRESGGVVLRYGQLYGGADTYFPDSVPPHPRIHVDEAARRTVALLDAPPGSVRTIAEPE